MTQVKPLTFAVVDINRGTRWRPRSSRACTTRASALSRFRMDTQFPGPTENLAAVLQKPFSGPEFQATMLGVLGNDHTYFTGRALALPALLRVVWRPGAGCDHRAWHVRDRGRIRGKSEWRRRDVAPPSRRGCAGCRSRPSFLPHQRTACPLLGQIGHAEAFVRRDVPGADEIRRSSAVTCVAARTRPSRHRCGWPQKLDQPLSVCGQGPETSHANR